MLGHSIYYNYILIYLSTYVEGGGWVIRLYVFIYEEIGANSFYFSYLCNLSIKFICLRGKGVLGQSVYLFLSLFIHEEGCAGTFYLYPLFIYL